MVKCSLNEVDHEDYHGKAVETENWGNYQKDTGGREIHFNLQRQTHSHHSTGLRKLSGIAVTTLR